MKNILFFQRLLKCLLLLPFFFSGPLFAQTPTPFDCSTGLGYILTNVNPGGGNVTSLYSFDLSNGDNALIQADILPAPNRFLNALGYNTVDNFLYGFRYGTNQIARVGANGAYELLTVGGLNSSGQYAAGDVTTAGIMYLFGTIGGSPSVIAIDLNPASVNYLVAQSQVVTGSGLLGNLNDWAYSSTNNKIYGMATDHSLIEYDIVTNTVTSLGTAGGLTGETGAFGTAFVDGAGGFYTGNNSSGNIYKITVPDPGDPYVAELYSNSLSGLSPGDGARCSFVPIGPGVVVNTACVETEASLPILIDVLGNDHDGSFPIDPATLVLIDPVSEDEVTSVNIPGTGTFNVVGTTGNISFNPEAGLTINSVKYRVYDTEGNASGEAEIIVRLCSLPVTLSAFAAKSEEDRIVLTWGTTMESNFDRFEVERKIAGPNQFVKIGTIRGDQSGRYRFEDTNVAPNQQQYYRLKMIDLDGTFAYSRMVAARIGGGPEFVIAPNPAGDYIEFKNIDRSQIVSVSLLNSGGKEIRKVAYSREREDFVDVSGLPSGIYFVKIQMADQNILSKKITIE